MSVYTTPASVLNAVTGKRVAVTTARGNVVGILTSVAYDTDGHPCILHIESPAVDVNFDALEHPVDIPWPSVTTIARINDTKTVKHEQSAVFAWVPDDDRGPRVLQHLDTMLESLHTLHPGAPDLPEPWRMVLEAHLATLRAIVTGEDT